MYVTVTQNLSDSAGLSFVQEAPPFAQGGVASLNKEQKTNTGDKLHGSPRQWGFNQRHKVQDMELTAESHSVHLSDENSIPLIGLGTYGNPSTVRKK